MSRNAKINTLLLIVVAALAVLPLALGLGDHKEEPFTGADAEAETAITELQPDYEPWFSPLYEPPSGEIESALFALQAALGAGVLAYYFGLRRGRRQGAARAGAAGTEAAGTEAAGTEGVPAAAEAGTGTGIGTDAGTGTGAGTDAGTGTRTGSDSGAGAASGVRAVDGRDA
ncbi:energy-coupling factor ABC transporter substrate-binding protein [Streptomyces venezuelae]|uniref:energy-coupling factor ABC transporter substrate-binding protein n=1 Tax=Streptomyces venezuelae TaxID=54571 RepID=UPI00123DB8B1|nr:energy-coupling factor ABC transporter substrate-binding protein [Streptomyces venezuelae]QES16782.1 energy-coupling factor ABC transporter substrate-binding protein [Streptomyces venezuelae]